MPYDYNYFKGISILKWDIHLEDYVFDHNPFSVVYLNQEHKFMHIKKDSRYISIIDHDDTGFNDELTIYISSVNNMLKTGARNLIRMFHAGWLATKQGCYIILRCQVKLSTTSCSIISMIDNNTMQGAHKNKIIGRDNIFIDCVSENNIQLRDNNLIKLRYNNKSLTVNNGNKIICTNNNKNILCNDDNLIICQDNCNITVNCDCTIITGSNCTITCLGDHNHISCLNNCTIICKQYNSIFCQDDCTIICKGEDGINCGLNTIIINRTTNQIFQTTLENTGIISGDVFEEYEITGTFKRNEFISFFTENFIGTFDPKTGKYTSSWTYGIEEPEPLTPFDWLLPKGYPDDCEGIVSWHTDEIFEEIYDECCPQQNIPPQDQTPDELPPCDYGLMCTGGTGNTGSIGQYDDINPDNINQLLTCDMLLSYAEDHGYYSTFDEYLQSLNLNNVCILNDSTSCTFDTTSGCPYDATSICKLHKFEITRTAVLTGGTGGTGGTGSPNIPDSHLFVQICS